MKEQLQKEIDYNQQLLDQTWKLVDDGFITLEQIIGCMAQGGIIQFYLYLIHTQVKTNRMRRLIDDT